MSKKVELKKIEIVIGDDTISLSVEQAKELSKILNDLLGKDTTTIVQVPYQIVRPYPYVYWSGGWNYSGNSSATYRLTTTGDGITEPGLRTTSGG